jgi:ketosteroid isomerase-like protein
VLDLAASLHLASGPPAIASNKIERSRAHGGVEQPAIVKGKIAPPEPHESFLHHVFGVGSVGYPLPGKEEKPGSEVRKTDFPIFMSGDILHDPSRSLVLKRRQLFVLSTTAKIFSLILATSPAIGLAQNADITAAREMVRCDRQFCDLSAQKGMPAACLEYFAENGIAFSPAAVNGKKYWASHHSFDGTLVWQPIFAAVARATDLGYTTGPWELKRKDGGSSVAFGQYVTLWRRLADGQWKIALDAGTDNAQPGEPPPSLQVLPADPATGVTSSQDARRTFRTTYDDFLTQSRSEIGKALLAVAADTVRVYRDNSAPAAGIVATRVMLGPDHGREQREHGHIAFSKLADLAYTYGNYSEERGNIIDRGTYLTIWRSNLNGDWQLVLDLKKKLPSGKS